MRLLLVVESLTDFADALRQVFFIDLMSVPEMLHQFLACDDPIALLDQIKQNVEALPTDGDGLSTPNEREGACVEVELRQRVFPRISHKVTIACKPVRRILPEPNPDEKAIRGSLVPSEIHKSALVPA